MISRSEKQHQLLSRDTQEIRGCWVKFVLEVKGIEIGCLPGRIDGATDYERILALRNYAAAFFPGKEFHIFKYIKASSDET